MREERKQPTIYHESERGSTLCLYESLQSEERRWRRGGGDKALIKRDPQSLIIQTASAAGLINGLDLDDSDPLSAPINNNCDCM